MTVFIFTDKVQKLLGKSAGNIYFGIFLILASVAIISYAFYIKFHDKKRSNIHIVGGLLFLILSGSWLNNENQYYKYLRDQYSELASIYQNEEYKIVEGNVEVIHEEPEGGHDSGDIIRINKVEFEFSCFHNTFGYNRTIVFGGVLTEGKIARVYYYQPDGLSSRDVVIVRIDMLEKIASPEKLDPLLPCAGY